MKKAETNEEVNNLLDAFEDPKIDEEVDAVNMQDPSIKTRSELFNFFSSRLAGLTKREAFKDKIQVALEDHIEGGEVTFAQLLSLYKIVYTEDSLAAESVISLLKPAAGTPNPLLTAMDTRKAVDDGFSEMHHDLDTKSVKSIDMLYRALKRYETQEGPEE